MWNRQSLRLLVLVAMVIGSVILWKWFQGGRQVGRESLSGDPSSLTVATDSSAMAHPPLELGLQSEIVESRSSGAADATQCRSGEWNVRIRVVRQDTGQAVAGAELRWWTVTANSFARSVPVDAVARTVTDADGRAQVHADGEAAVVEAGHGPWFGTAKVFPEAADAAEVALELFPDADVAVRVLDAEGRPVAGVGVVMVNGELDYDLREACTGADGVALLDHVVAWMNQHRALHEKHHNYQAAWRVVARVPLQRAVEAAVDLDSLPERTIDLLLPATGSVVVEVFDAAGRPVPISGPACLAATQQPEAYRDSNPLEDARSEDFDSDRIPNWFWMLEHFPLSPGAMYARHAHRKVVFAPVGLGLDLEVVVQRNLASTAIRVTGAGPRRPGEVVTLRHTCPDGIVTFEGRVLRADGTVVSNTEVFLEWVETPPPEGFRMMNHDPKEALYSDLGTVRTDATGRFFMDFHHGFDFDGTPHLAAEVERNTSRALVAEIRLDPSRVKGVCELGNFVLRPAAVLAGGLVIDENGSPVAGAWVDGPIERGGNQSRIRDQTDAQGHFTMRGILHEPELVLNFTKPSHASRHLWGMAVGTSDLVVELPRSGGICGALSLPAGASGGRFSISMLREEAFENGHHDNLQSGLEDDGSFDFDGLYPGTWTVGIKSGSTAIVERGGIVVASGLTTDLGLLEADTGAHTIELAITSEVGGSPLAGSYLVCPTGGGRVEDLLGVDRFDRERQLVDFEKGRIVVVADRPRMDVVVFSPGHRILVADAREGRAALALRPAIEVRLRVEGIAALPKAPLELKAELRHERQSGFPYSQFEHGLSSALGHDFTATAQLGCPGRYRVQWWVRQESPGGHRARGIGGGDILEVLDHDEPQEFTVRLEGDFSQFDLDED